VYEIARHFTLKARRTAARLTYTGSAGGKRQQPRAKYGGIQCCPLGVMLLVDRKLGRMTYPTGMPLSDNVAGCLTLQPDGSRPEYDERELEARVFINHWDARAIDDLAQALGVTTDD